MYYIIRPIHDRVWRYKIKRSKKINDLVWDGMLLIISIAWFPMMIGLVCLGVYITISSIINFYIGGILGGLILTLLFGFQIFYMWKHREKAKKRWAKKK